MPQHEEASSLGVAVPAVDLPTDRVRAIVSGGFAEVLDSAEVVDADASFFDLGGDSFRAVRLAALLSRELGVELPALAIVDHPTIALLVAVLAEDRPAATGPVLTVRAEGGRPPWFLVSERANPEMLRPLAGALGADQPVHILRPEALWRGRVTQRTLQDAATGHVQTVQVTAPSGPLALFGNCSDGVGAYELARQLRELGREVAVVAISDAPRPAADPWLDRRGPGWLRYLHQPFGTFHRRRGALASVAHEAWRAVKAPRSARMVVGGYRHQARALRLLRSGGPIPPGRELAYARYLYAHRLRTYDPPPAPGLPMMLLTSDEHGEMLRTAWTELVGDVVRVPLAISHDELLALRPPVTDLVAEVLRDTLDRAMTAR